MKMRSQGYYRNVWKKVAIRRQKLDRAIRGDEIYTDFHRYADGKIHCSCGLCSCKTSNHNRHSITWAPNYNPSIPDRRQNDSMNYQMYELEMEE